MKKSSLNISKIVIDKISKINKPTYAKLYGTHSDNTTILLAVQLEDIKVNNIEYSLPTEVDQRAILSVNNESINETEIIKKLKEQIMVTDNPIFISCNLNETNKVSAFVLVHEQLQMQPFDIISEQEIYELLVYVRLTGQLSLKCSLNRKSYDESMSDLKKSVAKGNFAFHVSKTPIYILGTSNEIGNYLSNEALFKNIVDSTNNQDYLKKNESSFVFDVEIMKNRTKERFDGEDEHGPICVITKKDKEVSIIPVKIETLSLISKRTNFSSLYDILVESVIKYLNAFHLTILKKLDAKAKPVLPEVYHCYPEQCGHFVSIWLPRDVDQKTLEGDRKFLHEKLLLPTNKPMLRRENKCLFKGSSSSGGPLLNPHKNLKNTNNGGKIAVVKGYYYYYHYGQNNINDIGWGCAYRSLQTLASWFRLQGYTDKEVPTFEEIQKCLVDIGDKPSNFIGSRQWIGSMEVNFVLSTLLGITCRIVNVSNGGEMAFEGPQLVRHFEDFGSPIMIGGANLAHTILGVDYNQITGGIRFLILDPHYSGPEDLRTIQTKGWCEWKNVDFWKKNCYYNMCLPLVPSGV